MYLEHHRKEKQRLASQRFRAKQPKRLLPIIAVPDVPITELAWIAGLFEGEGTVGITGGGKRPYTRMFVSLTSTDYEIVKAFVDRWSGQLWIKQATGNARRHWTWRLSCKKAEAYLIQIRPYIRTKRVREKCDLALKVQSTRRQGTRNGCIEYREMQNSFKAQMHILNKRGNGKTVAEHARPMIAQAYKSG